MKKIILIFVFLGSYNIIFSQEDPIRIGVKLGYPQIAGLNLELVTPALDGHLSADGDLSYFSLSVGDSKAKYTYFCLGANYYFFDDGSGLYGGLGYSRQNFNADLKVTDSFTGTSAMGNASLAFNNFYFKVGGKHGGLIYFRWNIGYAINLNDGKLEAEATINGIKQQRIESPPISGGGFMGDIGLGISF